MKQFKQTSWYSIKQVDIYVKQQYNANQTNKSISYSKLTYKIDMHDMLVCNVMIV